MPEPLITFQRNFPWRNKHLNVKVEAERLYDVWNRYADGSRGRIPWKPGLEALVRIVLDAEAAGKRVRGLGGSWSLSGAAVSEDFMLNTKPLNYRELGIKPQNLADSYTGNPERLVFAQCGTSVLELNRFLERRGLALPTAGASNGQTIVGAISTGTHGAANRVGSMQDYMLGLHIVAEGGKHYWLERSSRPVVNERFCHILGAKLLRDDELFHAALVSFGSFGVVHAVLFAATPIYLLEKHVRRYDFARVRPVLDTLDVTRLELPDGDDLPFHFEVVLNPYGTRRGAKGAFVRAMYKRRFAETRTSTPSTVVSGPGDDVLSLLGAVTHVVPETIPFAVEELLDAQLEEVAGERGTPGAVFGSTSIQGYVMSTEIGVAQQDASNAVDAIVEVARRFPFAGLAALRYVKGSKAHLAFTRFAPRTCTIELPSAGSPRTQEAFERIWDELEHRGIPYTLHWGQCLRYDPARVAQAFGRRAVRFRRARQRFLKPAGRRTFSNDLLQAAGLAG